MLVNKKKKKKKKKKKTMEHNGDGDISCNWCAWKRLLKGFDDLEVRGQVKTIQTTALLRSARILTRVPETWKDLLSLRP